uniref:Crystallin beta-gamma domain containing 1 n=1 Tax=Bubo bubo TaxID=30461 RepID=A0A8C0ESY9_BUBBB
QFPDSSREENKKKPVLERLGNLFGTGKRKNVKSSLEHTSHQKGERSVSPHRVQPVYCRHIKEGHEAPQVQKQARNVGAVSATQEYNFSGEVGPPYRDTISEWSSRGVSSDSEWSADWSSSSETIKNSFFESSLNVETLELEKESITDINNSTTPDFIKSLRNLSSEDLEKSILSHKQLVNTWVSEEPGHAKPKDLPYEVLTVDIYLRKTDELLNEPVTVTSEEDCSYLDTMDKKSTNKRSGKRRKSQSSSDIPNGERNQTETTAKEESVFEDDVPSEVFSDKIINSERKAKSPQQTPERNSSSPGNNQDLKVGSAHKGASKTEADKGKQQISNTTPARRRSYKKNQSDGVPISPTGLKGQVKDYSSKRQPIPSSESNPMTKRTSVEKGSIPVAFGEDSLESPKVSLADKTEDTALVFAEGRNETKAVNPAKPKNVELNFKAPTNQDSLESEQDTLEKPVNKTNSNIANKISLFENKCANQSQRPPDIPASKNSTVPSTFVGRAKLKFGKLPKESEQPDKTLNKQSSRQKLFENGTPEKESTAELKGKNEEGSASYEDIGKTTELKVKAAISLFNQSSKIDASSNSMKQPDPELTTAKKESSPFKLSSHSPSKSEDVQDTSYQRNNTNTEFHRSEEEMLPNTEVLSPCNDDKYPLPSHQFSRSELKNTENGDKKAKPGDLSFAALQYDDSSQDSILISEHSIDTQKSPGKTCNGSAEDDSIFDSPSDMKKFAETIKNLDSLVCLPQKKKRSKLPKSPAPHFAMPPIHEDNLEKVFDPTVFTFGLGLRREKTQDLLPAQQIKMQSLETIARVRPKRASTEQSIIFKALQSCNREEPAFTQEINGKENIDGTDGEIKRSRLEKSSLFSSLLSSTSKEKFFNPSVTSVNNTTTFTTDSSGMPPLQQDASDVNFEFAIQSLSDMKFPSFVEKYMQADSAKKELSLQMPHYGNPEKSFSSWLGTSRYESNVPTGLLDVDVSIVVFKICLKSCPAFIFSINDAISRNGQSKINPRPGKLVIHCESDYQKNGIEVFHDVLDCSSWVLSPTILVKVIRGCWILYEKPNFEGPSIPLEEGELELPDIWGTGTSEEQNECKSLKPAVIGSIRHVVKDYRVCRIDLYTEPEGLGIVTSFFDDTEETGVFGTTQKTCSIKVHWGIWLIYEEPGFQGVPLMLEPGEYPNLAFWEKKEAYIRSMRPLKMGGRKVEFSGEPKVIIYEKPFFEGRHVEIESEVFMLDDKESEEKTRLPLTSVGSMKVLGGLTCLFSLFSQFFGFRYTVLLWVAYENPEFTGEQYILAKGLYPSIEAWGGKNCKISSVQPIIMVRSSFYTCFVQLFSEPEFKGNCQIFEKNTRCIDSFAVKSSKILDGSCIVYDQEEFTGNQYVLEEGIYPDLTAMGCSPQAVLKSLRIINIELSEPCIALFEKVGFQGKKIEFSTEVLNLQFLGYSPRIASVQVLGGIWIIYEHSNYRGRQMLLSPTEIPDWYKVSGYCQIGSLRPLLQKRVYFRLRNRETGKFMSADGNLDNLNLLRIQVAEDADSDDQIWVYQDGFIRCQMAEDCCLTIVGNLITPGSKLGLSFERNEDKQYWHISADGRIYSKMKPKLVLDIKGGTQYDRDHVVVNTVNEEKLTQCWEPLVV